MPYLGVQPLVVDSHFGWKLGIGARVAVR